MKNDHEQNFGLLLKLIFDLYSDGCVGQLYVIYQ